MFVQNNYRQYKNQLNSKGVPGIQNNIFLENCIRRISLNITILNIIAIIWLQKI